jgi:hypothetical protein
LPGKKANKYLGFWIDISPANEFFIMRKNLNNLSTISGTFNFLYFISKNPGVAIGYPGADLSFQENACHKGLQGTIINTV